MFVFLGLLCQVDMLFLIGHRKPTGDEANDSDEEIKKTKVVRHSIIYSLFCLSFTTLKQNQSL